MRIRLVPEERRSQLIDATVAILEDVAGCDIVIDDVASKAGVSRSLVYRYFSGVEDLLGHAHRRFFSNLHTELARIDVEGGPLDELQAVIATTVRFAATQPARFCNVVDGRPSRAAHDDPLIAAIERLAPALRPQTDAALVATATAALIESGIVCWLRNDRTDADTAIELLSALAASGLHQRGAAPFSAESARAVERDRAPGPFRDPAGTHLRLVPGGRQSTLFADSFEAMSMTTKEKNP